MPKFSVYIEISKKLKSRWTFKSNTTGCERRARKNWQRSCTHSFPTDFSRGFVLPILVILSLQLHLPCRPLTNAMRLSTILSMNNIDLIRFNIYFAIFLLLFNTLLNSTTFTSIKDSLQGSLTTLSIDLNVYRNYSNHT